jgi:toxin FitB
MYLLDTDVLSAWRKLDPAHSVALWLTSQSPLLHISAITIMEVERGIEKQRHVDPNFAGDLENWLQAVLSGFETRILPVTVDIAKRWGRMQFQLRRSDSDVAILAVALEHGLTVVTRNVRHFDGTGAAVLNPFDMP